MQYHLTHLYNAAAGLRPGFCWLICVVEFFHPCHEAIGSISKSQLRGCTVALDTGIDSNKNHSFQAYVILYLLDIAVLGWDPRPPSSSEYHATFQYLLLLLLLLLLLTMLLHAAAAAVIFKAVRVLSAIPPSWLPCASRRCALPLLWAYPTISRSKRCSTIS